MPITISDGLAAGIMRHLNQGGSRGEADALAALLEIEANAPARAEAVERDTQQRVAAAVSAAAAAKAAE